MAKTLQEAKAELLTINAAISEIYQGKRRKRLQVGTHEFTRFYENVDPASLLDTLLRERQSLTDYINSLEATTPVYRVNSNIPIIVGRF